MKMRGYTDERHYMQVDAFYHYLHGEPFPPVMVEIDPSGVCNHKCHFCYSQYRVGREQLPTDVLHRVIDQLADLGVRSILWQGSGEPLMRKGLADVIEHAGKRGLSQTLTTNGALFTPDVQERIIPHLHYIRFSVIDDHPARYCYLHGCEPKQWDMLDANMRAAVTYRSKHKYEIYFTATVYLDETNFHAAYNIVEYYKELGLDYIVIQEYVKGDQTSGWNLPSAQFTQDDIDAMRADVMTLNDDNFSVKVRYPINDATFISGMLPDIYRVGFCQGPKLTTTITADGDVIPCWRAWGKPELSFGNVKDMPFADIWNGDQRQAVMRYINTTPPEGSECSVCNHWKANNRIHALVNRTKWSDFLI